MKIEWKSCFRVGISIFLLYLCIHYWSVVSGLLATAFSASAPLIIGCAIAYMVNILMSFYERHYFPKSRRAFFLKSRRPVCLIAAIITLLAVIALIVILIVPQLISCIELIISQVTAVITKAIAYLESHDILSEDLVASLVSIDWKSRLEQIISVVTSGIGSVMNIVITTVSSLFSGIVTALISVIFAIYLLVGKDKLNAQFKKLMNHFMKPRLCEKVLHILSILNDSFRRYIVGQCTEAVILGALCTVGMWILQLPYAAMIGPLIAFTALIPIAGAYIGAGVGAFMILTVSPIKAIIFLIFIVVLQQLEGNLIYPKVVGSSIGLPGIWVLTAVTLGGGLMGILGMLLGVPLAAALYRLLKEKVNAPAPAPVPATEPEPLNLSNDARETEDTENAQSLAEDSCEEPSDHK